ncbi:MAG: hypothetical protein KDD32_04055 [Bacteroidetes bacterium]|nr:hypothetical protein [Bacteroidota bacterium]
MNAKWLILPVLLIVAVLFDACETEDGIVCTLEFRTIGVTVIGEALTDHYTIRIANNDTIRPQDFGFDDDYYVILDDGYQSNFAGTQESFQFIGEIDDSVVIRENYVIVADQCHISKVSGLSQITL